MSIKTNFTEHALHYTFCIYILLRILLNCNWFMFGPASL